MELFQSDALATLAGASAAVTVVVAIAKSVFGISGRASQIVALGVALAIAVVFGRWSSSQAAFVAILNGFVVAAASIGIDQAANYGRGALGDR